MTISYHERPGVYSDYEASSVYAGAASGKTVGLAARSDAAAGIYALHSGADASALGGSAKLTAIVQLLFQNGAGIVLLYPTAGDTAADYAAAFAQILAQREARVLMCDSDDPQVAAALKTAVEAAASDRNECIAVFGTAAQTDDARIAQAQALNCARMIVTAPACYCEAGGAEKQAAYSAAALAGLLAGQQDPALPLGGATLLGLAAVDTAWTEAALDSLIGGGVTPLEFSGGGVQIVRGVSTKTSENGAADTTWKEITTVMIVDDVISGVRSSLQRRFPRSKNNAQTRSAIRDQVLLELESRVRRQIIEHYGELSVTANAEDPTVCDVVFSFGVSHGLSHILLSAHITV